MSNHLLKYRIGRMATWPVMLLGWVMILLAFPAAISQIIAALLILIVGIAIVTSSHGFQINLETKRYRESLFLLGFTFGEWHTFESIEKIFINSTTDVNRVYSRANQGYSYKKQKFASFIKFSDGKKVRLYEMGNKEALLRKLNTISQDLSTIIQDNTEPQS